MKDKNLYQEMKAAKKAERVASAKLNKVELDITEGSIIIKEDVASQYAGMDYAILDELYKKGDLVMLDEGLSNTVDLYNYVGESKYIFGNYTYLKEFTNRLIQYRVDLNKKDPRTVTKDDLYLFMCKFIKTHPELAAKNKEKREKMLAGQSEEEIFNSQYKKII